MIEQLPQTSEKVLGFKMSGKLHDEDYKRFVPLVNAGTFSCCNSWRGQLLG
jgi:hypothetical protein